MFQDFLTATGVVALAEIGDKTQLLAFMLAARFKKPAPIILGIFAATIVNHALAGALGGLLAAFMGPDVLRWVISLGFILMGIWILVPDKIDEEDASISKAAGIFTTTVITFFLAEMGDKTQIATVALAAHAASVTAVVIGTTLGMMIANVPAVLFGNGFAKKLPLPLIHGIAAVIFIVIGVIAFIKMPH